MANISKEEEYRKDLRSKFFLSEPQLDLACQGFKDGYREGKDEAKQWHNLQENPDNLPPMLDDEKKISHSVWIHIKNWGTDRGYYDYSRKLWIVGGYYDPSRHIWLVKNIELLPSDVLAWCEIPKYKEE